MNCDVCITVRSLTLHVLRYSLNHNSETTMHNFDLCSPVCSSATSALLNRWSYNGVTAIWNYDLCSPVLSLSTDVLFKSLFSNSVTAFPNSASCSLRVQLNRAPYCDLCCTVTFSSVTSNLLKIMQLAIAVPLLWSYVEWTAASI